MTGRTHIALLACALCSIAAAQGQGLPGGEESRQEVSGREVSGQARGATPIIGAEAKGKLRFSPIEMHPVSQMWLDEQLDPILQQRRRLHRLMAERARQSVIVRPKPLPEHEGTGEAARWKFTIGNTSVNNWSPFPDRMLDARTLRFPMPGGRTAGDRNKGK